MDGLGPDVTLKTGLFLVTWDTAVKYHLVHTTVLLTAAKQPADRAQRKASIFRKDIFCYFLLFLEFVF